MSCPDCFSGSTHEGKPTGREEKTHGRDAYIAEPSEGTAIKGVIVMISDAFGWKFQNLRILADKYAAGGFRVYLPDFLEGHDAPVWVLEVFPKVTRDWSLKGILVKPYQIARLIHVFVPFYRTNKFPTIMPRVTKFFEDIRCNEAAELPLGATGFCFGGKHTIVLAHGDTASNGKPLVDAAFTAHPSHLELPGDIEKVTKPVSIAIGDKDAVLSMKGVEQIKEIFGRLEAVSTEVVVFPGAEHGFSVRGDETDEKVKQRAIEATEQAVNWFHTQFGKVAP
ncbi:MAG: hypothetical protein M1834_005550 [Cirrosporium novae-zelandiae]|nr:MAG: hypothetical protein M1834_005550 [Cirrosporium novae-zelandiae]